MLQARHSFYLHPHSGKKLSSACFRVARLPDLPETEQWEATLPKSIGRTTPERDSREALAIKRHDRLRAGHGVCLLSLRLDCSDLNQVARLYPGHDPAHHFAFNPADSPVAQ